MGHFTGSGPVLPSSPVAAEGTDVEDADASSQLPHLPAAPGEPDDGPSALSTLSQQELHLLSFS
jgi:hypothetical protein